MIVYPFVELAADIEQKELPGGGGINVNWSPALISRVKLTVMVDALAVCPAAPARVTLGSVKFLKVTTFIKTKLL